MTSSSTSAPSQLSIPVPGLMEPSDPRLPRRFWSKVSFDPSSNGRGCWLWTAYLDRHGYPRFSVQIRSRQSRSVLAHRYAYAVSRDLNMFRDLRGLDIHHVRCESRSCVRPAHMREVQKSLHGYWHGKMRGYGEEVCTGTAYCLCWRCCEEMEEERIARGAEGADGADGVPF